MDDELRGFKSIDLRKYAASLGYEPDPGESTRSVAVMRRGADKIHIRAMANGDFTWYSFHDGRGGSIIDFVQAREGIRNLGEVRKKLRVWDGRAFTDMPRYLVRDVTAKDPMRVRRELSKMQIARRHPYLENERCIPGHLLASPAFFGKGSY